MEVALPPVLELRSLHLAVRLSIAVSWRLGITPTLDLWGSCHVRLAELMEGNREIDRLVLDPTYLA